VSIRVAPMEAEPTHHISLKDRNGKLVGLTICDGNGVATAFRDANIFTKNPQFTTAFKQTSGQGGYDIFDYPYSPIVQDDLSGGRGNQDFERDSTKHYDAYRTASGRANKAYAGPQEQYATGAHRSLMQSMPGSVDWVQMTGANRYIYKRFLATGITTSKVWLNLRKLSTPGDLKVELWSDTAGALNVMLTSLTVPDTWTADILSEWLNDTLVQTLTSAYYWLVVYADASDNDRKHWKIAVNESVGTTYATETWDTTPTAATYDLYYRLTDADSDKSCIFFEYKEMQYAVVSGSSGAPKLYMAGDRGAADSNAGQLDKLIDASKAWTTNEWVGYVVMVVDGPGKLEPQPWRTITANAAGSLTMDTPWTIQHTTTTEYVILSPKIKEITGHGLTAPVTSVLVTPMGVVYFCMGDSVTVRRFRAYNDAGTWRDFDDAANCQANEGTVTAVFMVYKPQAQRLVVGNNDLSGAVSVNINTNATIPAWGTALTWGTALNADNKYRRINGMIVHPDSSGNEVVWVFKTDMVFVATGTTTISGFYPAGPEEIRNVRSMANGVKPMRHDVYLYFPLLQGLERYYGGSYTDMGPNLGEGLPENRRGSIVDMLGYPGRFFIAIDAGVSGYSSIMASGGWHEHYRAPKGQRIKSLAFQVIPGTGLDRMWVFQGNDLVWLPFPSDTVNELEDSNYPYTPEFSVELARMHAGMYDVQKLIKFLKLQTDRLEVDSEGRAVCWFEVDYKTNDDDAWQTLEDPFVTSPTQEVDFTQVYGLAGKRLKFRIRGYTRNANKTPVFLAIVIFAVMRVDVKNMYGPLNVLCEDNERIGMREEERTVSAAEKLQTLEDWGDSSNDSLLLMNSVASLFDGKMVFLNVGTRRQIRFGRADGNEHGGDAYVVSVSLQDA